MGIKAIKKHYKILHNILRDSRGVCIGSGYISDLIVIDGNGCVVKRPVRTSNEDLNRYIAEFDAAPDKLKELYFCEDTFDASLPVWTYNHDGTVVQKFCEEYGWPNTTHDGEMMYENTFSQDRFEVAKWAKESIARAIRHTEEAIERMELDLAAARGRLAGYVSEAKILERDYPNKTPTAEPI